MNYLIADNNQLLTDVVQVEVEQLKYRLAVDAEVQPTYL